METTRTERLLCLPMWKLDQKWAERNMYNRFSRWLRGFSFRHYFLGSLVVAVPAALIASALGFALYGSSSLAPWGVFAGVVAALSTAWLTFYNHWRFRNDLK